MGGSNTVPKRNTSTNLPQKGNESHTPQKGIKQATKQKSNTQVTKVDETSANPKGQQFLGDNGLDDQNASDTNSFSSTLPGINMNSKWRQYFKPEELQ